MSLPDTSNQGLEQALDSGLAQSYHSGNKQRFNQSLYLDQMNDNRKLSTSRMMANVSTGCFLTAPQKDVVKNPSKPNLTRFEKTYTHFIR